MAYGAVVSAPIVVHEPPPAGRRWTATDPSPEPPVSPALAASATVCRRFSPGSPSVLVGPAVSDLTSFAEFAVVQLPALSATRYRYCAHLPDATESGLVSAAQPAYAAQASLLTSAVWRSSAFDGAVAAEAQAVLVVPAD